MRDFRKICRVRVCTPFQDTLGVKIWVDLLKRLWSYGGFKFMGSGYPQTFSAPSKQVCLPLALYTPADLARSSVAVYNCQPGQWAQITRGHGGRVPQNWECVTLMQIDPPDLQKIPLRSHQRTPFRTKNSFSLSLLCPTPRIPAVRSTSETPSGSLRSRRGCSFECVYQTLRRHLKTHQFQKAFQSA